MTVRVGINGFGRIGRSFTRALLARGADAGVELVAVNEPMGDTHTVAFLLKHDSIGGTLRHDIEVTANGISIDGHEVHKLEVMDPAEIPWSDHGVDVVIESTGLFTGREKAAGHLGGSVQRVIISAPSGDADATICMGVNDNVYDASAHRDLERVVHHELPGAARQGAQRHLRYRAGPDDHGARVHERPVARRSRQGHAQRQARPAAHAVGGTVDHPEQHRRRAIGLVLPELKGKLDGTALRVPTPTGSITDLSANLANPAGIDEINEAFAKAAADPSYRGVLEYSDEDLVSADIVHNPASCIFSSVDTMANGRMVKVLGWYDNEWGYSNRLVDLVAFVGK